MRTLNPLTRRQERCREVRSRLSEYLDGELGEREVRRVERHLRWCPRCRRMLGNLDRTMSALRKLAPDAPAGD